MAFNQKIREELAKMLAETVGDDDEAERTRRDINGFDESIHSLLRTMDADPTFDTYDLVSNTEFHKIDIGPIDPELEWDLFDQIRVSNELPIAIMNIDKNKVNLKGKYFSNQRRFKVYYSPDINTPHAKYLKHWLDSDEMNEPFTIKMKVMLKPPKFPGQTNEDDELNENTFDENLFNTHSIRQKSQYINVVFNFGDDANEKGLFIELEKNYSDDKVDSILSILQTHITGFNMQFKRLSSIVGTFVIDKILVEPRIFRQILTGNYNKLKTDPATGQTIPTQNSFKPWPFVWTNETLKGLSLRKHFILNFRIGDVKAKILISRNIAKNNDLFYFNNEPVKMRKDAPYDIIKISDVASMEDARMVKSIISAMFYLYGQPIQQFVGYDNYQQPIFEMTTRSIKWANNFNYLLFNLPVGTIITDVMRSQMYSGATFGLSQRITSRDIQQTSSVIQKLRQIDPTFYGAIATGKPVSKGKKQPIPIVSTNDPDWQQILYGTIVQIYQDPQNAIDGPRQIIRYPFEVQDDEGETIGEVPITVVAPYFLICTEDARNFQLKENDNPQGSDGTFHPYLLACSTKKFVETPGNDPNSKFQALTAGLIPPGLGVALPTPPHYILNLLSSNKNNIRNNYRRTTYKILTKDDQEGNVPTSVEKIFNAVYSNIDPSKTVAQNAENELELTFKRISSPREPENLLHVLCLYGGRQDIRQFYLELKTKEEKVIFLKTQLKEMINRETNWNLSRQEFFDMDQSQVSEYFMQPNIFIDPKLFKTILEKFFKVFILCIRFDGLRSSIEIPRHKYLHVSKSDYPGDTVPIVIFKHESPTSARATFPQCEVIKMQAKRRIDMSPFSEHNWTLPGLKFIFDLANKTIDLSFSDIHDLKENSFLTGMNVTNNADIKPSLNQIFSPNNLILQLIDGAGKVRAFVHKFFNEDYGDSEITVMCEPMHPLNLSSFNDPAVIQSGRNPHLLLVPEEFDRALAFVLSLGVKLEDVSYKVDYSDEDLLVKSRVEEIIPKPKSMRTNLIDRERSKAKEMVSVLSSAQENKASGQIKETQISLLAQPSSLASGITAKDLINSINREARFEQLDKNYTDLDLRDQEKLQYVNDKEPQSVPLAVGIWFKLKGVQFYISTEAGEIPNRPFAENDIPFFEPEPDQTFFWQHDYYERVMNILIQLLRNLYIYSRMDDPVYFINFITEIDPNNEYKIIGVRRRLTSSKNFSEALVSYAQQYPTFFRKQDNSYVMIIDSQKTRDSLRQHLQQVQKLKLDIFAASGSRYDDKYKVVVNNNGQQEVVPSSDARLGIATVKYAPHVEGHKMIDLSNVTGKRVEDYTNAEKMNALFIIFDEMRFGLSDFMIENIERMDQFFNRPEFLEQFFVSPSDFTVRGPDQQVFTSEDDIRDYIDFLEFDQIPSLLTIPLPDGIDLIKTPQYLLMPDESLYVIQNVLGGNLRRVMNVMVVWARERINLGFYADEWDGVINNPSVTPYINTNLEREGYTTKDFHTDSEFAFLRFASNKYAAMIRITYKGKSKSISVPDVYRQ